MPLPLRGLAARRSPLALAGALAAAGMALTGCSQVAIIKSAPVSAASFDSSHGNDPLAAADGASLQTALSSQGQDWTVRLDLQPAAAGNITATNSSQIVAARAKVRDFHMTLTARGATQDRFSSHGQQAEQQGLEGLMENIAQNGYGGVTSVRIDVYFGSSHHSVLTWKSTTGFVYTVLDGRP